MAAKTLSFSAAGPRLWNDLPSGLWWTELPFPVTYLYRILKHHSSTTVLHDFGFIKHYT